MKCEDEEEEEEEEDVDVDELKEVKVEVDKAEFAEDEEEEEEEEEKEEERGEMVVKEVFEVGLEGGIEDGFFDFSCFFRIIPFAETSKVSVIVYSQLMLSLR